jgi:hypothetical protein
MNTPKLNSPAIVEAERAAALQILAVGRTPQALDAIAGQAQDHAERIVARARELIPPRPIACREGCTFCCHLRVLVTIPEVLRIAAHLRASLDSPELTALRDRIDAHRQRVAEAPGRTRPACPLLQQDRCRVYALRPMSCRGWNSLDVLGCEAHHADPSRGVRVPVYGPQYEVHALVQEGLSSGLTAAGLEGERVELVAALKIALEDERAAERWLAGEPVFAAANPARAS